MRLSPLLGLLLLACDPSDGRSPEVSCPRTATCGPLDHDCDGQLDEGLVPGDRCDGDDLDRYREGVVECVASEATCSDPDVDESGRWSAAFGWPAPGLRTEAVHMMVLANGRVLSMYHGSDLYDSGFPNLFDPAVLWDPKTGEAVSVAIDLPPEEGNLFCAGHNHLADGRVFFTGGDVTGAKPAAGEDFTFSFDGVSLPDAPDYDPWTYLGDMAGGRRWYPNNTSLADGSVLITSGAVVVEPWTVNEAAEVYLPAFNRFELRAPQRFASLYPWLHLLPDGRVVASGQEAQARVWDPTTDTWADAGAPRAAEREYGTAALLMLDGADPASPADVLVAGGCTGRDSARCCLDDLVIHEFEGDCDLPMGPDSETWECFASAELLGGWEADAPAWRPTGSMAHARAHAVATLLPDGNVVVTGGEGNDCRAAPTSELYHAEAGVFRPTADYVDPYNGDYHTSAVLLPDGRVLVSGGDLDALDDDGPTAMIWSPPYLDLDCCARPVILDGPTEVHHGQAFTLDVDHDEVDTLVFLRPGAATHDFNMDQRGVRVKVESAEAVAGGRRLHATAPLTPGLAPPGYYMLFALSVDGVPSEAHFVQLTAGECDTTRCDSPPPGHCADDATLVQPVAAGACFEGSCQYLTESLECPLPEDAPTGSTAWCEDGACAWGCPAGGTLCGELCCIDVPAGTEAVLPAGDQVYGELRVAGELRFEGAARLEVDRLVVEPGGVVRCAADGATAYGVGGDGDGEYAGGGAGGGAAAGAGGGGGASSHDGTTGGVGGDPWMVNPNWCLSGSPGGVGGGGGHGGEGGLGGGKLVIVAESAELAGALVCDGATGAAGAFDDGGGGGGAGGCVSIDAATLRVEPSASFSVLGAAGGEGGFCPEATCGGTYCGGGGGGGGGGALFLTCDSCTVDDVVVGKLAVDSSVAGRVQLDGGAGGPGGSGEDGVCDPLAQAGSAGASGLLRSY